MMSDNLDSVCAAIASDVEFKKVIKKNEKKGLLIETDNGYKIMKFKAGTISNMLTKLTKEEVISILQKTVNIYLRQKETILNKEYLESIGVKF
jgi:hypothetical protein